ncbi:hypothetical protein QCM77_20925 [Bradyrhizobium sp. SSUT18]|uniref:hypothetical protein n=1 Tax=Bradyrhizobium sp. SSUT18 TaxID=3040602 RepID=UPI00244839CC|nr:hypothetical protein [Bradyrhizobium sp. SSUT18]MDH2402406.1 hypothetical protein [Bradyrhizobium sp. SSUT18]
MTESDQARCAPALNQSANQTRRTILASLAAFSAALPAIAQASTDPIFAVIERHRDLSADYDAAVSISAKLEEGDQFDAADKISAERSAVLREYANELVHSKPITIAGVIALSRYAAGLREWEMPDDQSWRQRFLGTLADAITEISTTRPLAS